MASDEAREGSIDIPDEPSTAIDPYEASNFLKPFQPVRANTLLTDKVDPEDVNNAKEKFQSIAFAYAILSDSRRRERYDRTGSTSEILDDDEDFDWRDFFRAQYRKIDEDAIEDFSKTFKGSVDERAELLGNYTKYKGSMDRIYESTTLSSVLDDDERFRQIIDDAIASGEVEAYKTYTEEPQAKKNKRIKKAQREAEEAAEVVEDNKAQAKKSKKKGDGPGGLEDRAMAIQKNKQKSMSFLDNLEAKYGGSPKGRGKRKAPHEEPPEEAFEAVGKRVKKKKGQDRFTKKYGEGHTLTRELASATFGFNIQTAPAPVAEKSPEDAAWRREKSAKPPEDARRGREKSVEPSESARPREKPLKADTRHPQRDPKEVLCGNHPKTGEEPTDCGTREIKRGRPKIALKEHAESTTMRRQPLTCVAGIENPESRRDIRDPLDDQQHISHAPQEPQTEERKPPPPTQTIAKKRGRPKKAFTNEHFRPTLARKVGAALADKENVEPRTLRDPAGEKDGAKRRAIGKLEALNAPGAPVEEEMPIVEEETQPDSMPAVEVETTEARMQRTSMDAALCEALSASQEPEIQKKQGSSKRQRAKDPLLKTTKTRTKKKKPLETSPMHTPKDDEPVAHGEEHPRTSAGSTFAELTTTKTRGKRKPGFTQPTTVTPHEDSAARPKPQVQGEKPLSKQKTISNTKPTKGRGKRKLSPTGDAEAPSKEQIQTGKRLRAAQTSKPEPVEEKVPPHPVQKPGPEPLHNSDDKKNERKAEAVAVPLRNRGRPPKRAITSDAQDPAPPAPAEQTMTADVQHSNAAVPGETDMETRVDTDKKPAEDIKPAPRRKGRPPKQKQSPRPEEKEKDAIAGAPDPKPKRRGRSRRADKDDKVPIAVAAEHVTREPHLHGYDMSEKHVGGVSGTKVLEKQVETDRSINHEMDSRVDGTPAGFIDSGEANPPSASEPAAKKRKRVTNPSNKIPPAPQQPVPNEQPARMNTTETTDGFSLARIQRLSATSTTFDEGAISEQKTTKVRVHGREQGPLTNRDANMNSPRPHSTRTTSQPRKAESKPSRKKMAVDLDVEDGENGNDAHTNARQSQSKKSKVTSKPPRAHEDNGMREYLSKYPEPKIPATLLLPPAGAATGAFGSQINSASGVGKRLKFRL
ncbi:MAG: hypothetical protein M1831_005423 [Alyxoria varia]|nr:MAG: hypothetical protein M1831_005423 [Alyxoria varia]